MPPGRAPVAVAEYACWEADVIEMRLAADLAKNAPAIEVLAAFAAELSAGTRVERFDRRGTGPNEPFRSEFGQNSFKIQEFSLEKSKKIQIFRKISTFSKISAEFRQNFINI